MSTRVAPSSTAPVAWTPRRAARAAQLSRLWSLADQPADLEHLLELIRRARCEPVVASTLGPEH